MVATSRQWLNHYSRLRMGVERPKTPAEILADLEAGKIQRGNKNETRITLPNQIGEVEAIYNQDYESLTFTLNGITTEMTIRDGVIIQAELKNPIRGNTIFDETLRRQRIDIIQRALDEGTIKLP